MRRLYGALALVGAVALLVSLGAPWWRVTLESGAVVAVSGLTASPLASALLAVAAAAFGLGLILRGVWRRVVSFLQALAVGGAAYAIASLASEPEVAALSEIAALTGVTGSGALDLVQGVQPLAMLSIGVVGLVAATGAGIVGVLMPDRAPSTDRYRRSAGPADPKDSIAAWDNLSEGSDPTTR